MLWNFICQGDASKVSRNMYAGSSYVESDLVNSYMWDTTIVYIQAMGNTNYANEGRKNNTILKNTGETDDEKCHIFDMAANTLELTTEYSTNTYQNTAQPCTFRSCYWAEANAYTAFRSFDDASYSDSNFGVTFRVGIYVK